MRFKTFLEMAELKDELSGDNLDFYSKITFKKGFGEISYSFEDIEVNFINETISGFENENEHVFTKNSYQIAFFGKKGPVANRDKINPVKSLSVYKKVILVVKKFLQIFKPEGLPFSGYHPDQQRIYDLMYKMILSNQFVKISYAEYLRKDIFEKIMAQNDEKKQALVKTISKLKQF